MTFVFATYFSQGIALNAIDGTADWGWAMTVSALAVAVLSPIFGAIADIGGRRKPWLVVFTRGTIVGSALLWFSQPHHSFIAYTLVVVVLTNIAFEVASVFYNAMLPELVDDDHMGRLSGWGWGLGYIGGLACLIVALFAFVQAPTPLFGLDKESAEQIRIVGPLVAVWLLVFSIPIVLFTPDTKSTGVPMPEAVRRGLKQLYGTFRNLWEHRQTALFLVARMIYTDGLNTLFAFGGIFAAGTFGMSMTEVIQFGILLNVTAGIGALGFAWIDDWIGAKPTILIALVGLTLTGAIAISVEDVTWFWIAGAFLGHLRRPGAGREPLADGPDRAGRDARRDVRPLCAVRQGDGVSGAVGARHGDLLDRQPAPRHGHDPRVLRRRRDSAGADAAPEPAEGVGRGRGSLKEDLAARHRRARQQTSSARKNGLDLARHYP